MFLSVSHYNDSFNTFREYRYHTLPLEMENTYFLTLLKAIISLAKINVFW